MGTLKAKIKSPSNFRHLADFAEIHAGVAAQVDVLLGRMLELLDDWLVPNADGTVDLAVAEPLRVGLVAWRPQ